MMRLAKRIALSGIASRREAERLILEGRVTVNGVVVLTPVTFVEETDEVVVAGSKVSKTPDALRVWKYYKPRGVITTRSDPMGRRTVFEDIKGRINYEKVPICVGRLDFNSEGLLLLTNSGALARKFELPSSRISRTYKVRSFNGLKEADIELLRRGITIDGVHYGDFLVKRLIADVKPVRTRVQGKQEGQSSSCARDRSECGQGKNVWMEITLFEGKNREIRKVLKHFGCTVNRLIRVRYADIDLGNLKPHEIEEVDLSKLGAIYDI